MNLEHLNVVELSSEESVEITGGQLAYSRSELDLIFAVVITDDLIERGWY